jgi:hypothetical protein
MVHISVHFNHLAVAAKDKRRSATFLANLLGLPQPVAWGPFLSVTLDDGVRLDYAEPGVEFGGRGVYFDDPSGHHFELITQPYGADL